MSVSDLESHSISKPRFFLLQKAILTIGGPYLFELLKGAFFLRRFPRFSSPITFNDKISHRKLFDHDPRFPVVQDKSLARKFVEERVGSALLTRIYYCGDNVEAIDFDGLPESFVMKGTHGCGLPFMLLVDDKRRFQPGQVRRVAGQILSKSFGSMTNERWYAKIKLQVLIEELLSDDQYGLPLDYKFYVFHGEVRFVQVNYGGLIKHSRMFYDRNWHAQEFTLIPGRMGPAIPRPEPLADMINIAESIGKEFNFIRVDLYCVNNRRIVFGEITLAPGAGWFRFKPSIWDDRLGAMW